MFTQSNCSGKLNNVKHTTLRSTAIAERKSPSGATSAVDVASNHDAPTVGNPTEQTPDTFSIVDTTERVVELEVVNSELRPRQRNTDKEPTMDDPGEVKASPRQTMDNEEETPFFTRYACRIRANSISNSRWKYSL